MPSNPRKILVTSALPYANGSLHLGHLLEAIQADIWVRFQKARGADCLYICADDAHGTAIMLIAEKNGDKDFDFLIEEGLTHEQQHQELILTDIKHVFSVNPTWPTVNPALSPPPAS